MELVRYKDLSESMQYLFDNSDHSITCYHKFATDNKGNVWAIVLGWQDGFENADGSTERVCGKVAYQPSNSAMQEYDIDWTMPYDDGTSEVDDTEVEIKGKEDLQWLIQEAERCYTSYVAVGSEE